MNTFLLWALPAGLVLLFLGLRTDSDQKEKEDAAAEDEQSAESLSDSTDLPAENSAPVTYQHHWHGERRHRNRRII